MTFWSTLRSNACESLKSGWPVKQTCEETTPLDPVDDGVQSALVGEVGSWPHREKPSATVG